MDTLKKFAKYIIWIVLFFFFSNILIFVGLNSNYDNIKSSGNNPSQVQIEQAEATLVNGRIRGKIKNDGEEDLNGKYMKVDLYSPRNVLLGTDYLAINDLNKGNTDDFELFFKAKDVDHYDISFVDKIEKTEIKKDNKKEGYPYDIFEKLRFKTEFLDHELTRWDLFLVLLTVAVLG